MIDQYSFETEEEKEMYFIDKIIEQSQRKIEEIGKQIEIMENKKEKIIPQQMEKQKGI